ncbi:hypothetical protein GGH94_005530 [Coemansia aciculifera]|uniref:Uncharacterized protein n=1 Tax=Coemansia aciculifera TaxID=417176 RepID=A0A9W8IM45_9FUNG|nr:hypothetical protein GGH94_005530 [Coemansia aciculifera]KAJ2870233.1 hypothetical protein GGH93_005727 [Coemansia aciculifera]
MASTLPASEDPSTEAASKGASITPAFDDSRSETSTVDSDVDDVAADLSNLTFFTRLYELPIVNDAVSSIYRIAESNRYTSAIIGYAEKVGGLAEKSRPLLKPVERPIAALDGYATRSLELIESKYPIVAKPTSEVIETVQSQAKAVETKYPVVARTFAVAKTTANSALDRVDYLVDYVLPPRANSTPADDEDDESPESQTQQPDVTSTDSPLGKITIIVRKVPQRLGGIYYEQLESSRSAVDGIKQSAKDTATVYTTELSERSSKLLESVQERVKSTVNTTIPSLLPQFAQPYYEHSKDVVVTKATKLHAEYSRTDEDARSKVLNLILISGEQVPVLEQITSRVFGKATGTVPSVYMATAGLSTTASAPAQDKN